MGNKFFGLEISYKINIERKNQRNFVFFSLIIDIKIIIELDVYVYSDITV